MGAATDQKTVLDQRLLGSRKEWQLCGGDGSSYSIHFYTKTTDDGSCLIELTESSDYKNTSGVAHTTKAHTWTGTGTIIDALVAWRSANASVTSGALFEQCTNRDEDLDLAAGRDLIAATITEGEADSAHLQTLIDADADA